MINENAKWIIPLDGVAAAISEWYTYIYVLVILIKELQSWASWGYRFGFRFGHSGGLGVVWVVVIPADIGN